MTLQQFIAAKPANLRFGQWWSQCFLSHLTYEERSEDELVWLYNTRDDYQAIAYVVEYASQQQWEALENYTGKELAHGT